MTRANWQGGQLDPDSCPAGHRSVETPSLPERQLLPQCPGVSPGCSLLLDPSLGPSGFQALCIIVLIGRGEEGLSALINNSPLKTRSQGPWKNDLQPCSS